MTRIRFDLGAQQSMGHLHIHFQTKVMAEFCLLSICVFGRGIGEHKSLPPEKSYFSWIFVSSPEKSECAIKYSCKVTRMCLQLWANIVGQHVAFKTRS